MSDDLGTAIGASALMNGGFGGNALAWGLGGLIIGSLFSGGNGFFGGGNSNLSNEMNRGFDNQNTIANQREILGAVTGGTAQSVAATNQSFHDMLNVVQDKYGEITRDISGLAVQNQQLLANQNDCCCSTKMLISETGNSINANTTYQTQRILDAITANREAQMQNRIDQLELDKRFAGVVKYPQNVNYAVGIPPLIGGFPPFQPYPFA
jgi:hypothetical protein